MNMPRFLLLLSIVLLACSALGPSPSSAEAVIIDGLGDSRSVESGTDVLTVDYIGIWINGVTETGTDYPYGRVWLILYDPTVYAKMDTMEEDAWNRADEVARYEIPGPSSTNRWANGDEVIYKNFGIHDWASREFDSLVFRITVEEPDNQNAVDTLIWGVIFEDDTYDSDYEFHTDSVSIYFRTTRLPEIYELQNVTFQEIWIEHGIEVDGFKGIMVHANFQVDNLRAVTCRLAGFVHYSNSSESVQCQITDPLYLSPSGNLTIQRDFIPIYPSTLFSDMTVFIPYDAFPASDDFVDYYINLEVLDSDWNYVNSSKSPVFSVKKPS